MPPIRKFLALSSDEKLLLSLAGVLYIVFEVTLQVGSLKACSRVAERLRTLGFGRWPTSNVEWAITVASQCLSRSKGGCLPAALTGLVLAADDALELQVGVRKEHGNLEAHAWLEAVDGTVVYAGADPTQFQPLGDERPRG